jgi:hypothetical protein
MAATLAQTFARNLTKKSAINALDIVHNPLKKVVKDNFGKERSEDWVNFGKGATVLNTMANLDETGRKVNQYAENYNYQQGTFQPDPTRNQFHGGIKRRRRRTQKSRRRRRRSRRQRQTNKSRR